MIGRNTGVFGYEPHSGGNDDQFMEHRPTSRAYVALAITLYALMSMSGILFFYDIPVYRLPKDRYGSEQDRHVDRNMYGTLPEDRKSWLAFYESNPDEKANLEYHLRKSFGGPWIFNEVVGYIRLHFSGALVRFELWIADK